jgi:hypothetical protein
MEVGMNKKMKVIRAAVVFLIVFGGFTAYYINAAASSKTTDSALAFHDSMRKLWEDHITWTRLYIVSAAAGLPDQDATAQRLLQNQVDIGNAIKPYYGDSAGNQLTELLQQHILIAAQAIADAKNGNTAAFNNDLTQWYANANDIAVFLHNANPDQWPLDQLQAMMKEHLDLTLQEASDRLNGNFQGDIQDYELVHAEILQMADMLSSGITAQFPKQFK